LYQSKHEDGTVQVMAFRSNDFMDKNALKNRGKKVVIAIDGPAASGKGTLARKIAERFGFVHLDTGMLYRGLGYAVINQGKNPEDETDVKSCLGDFLKNLNKKTLSNPALRTDEVGSAASKVAAIPFVRTALLDYQRDFSKSQPEKVLGVVLDGRDIGTVVCPDADIKVFVTASAEVRAERRYKELLSRGIDTDFDTVFEDIKQRDERDSNRPVAPLKPAVDSYQLDTSQLNTAEALGQVIDVIRAQLVKSAPKP
jgi:cytidylate kinase